MISLTLRDARNKTRARVDDVDLSGTTESLKERAAEITRVEVEEQQMVYCGRLLDDTKTLLSQGLSNGATIYIFKRKMQKKESPKTDSDDIQPVKLANLLEKAMNNQLHQTSIKKLLQDPDAMEQLIIATPSLKKDPVALSLLQDPELLLQVAETANVEKIIEEHPALAKAASYVIAAVTEDTKLRSQDSTDDAESTEMADLERFEPGLVARAEMIAAQEEGIQERQASQPHQISPAQLAMALSQAGVTATRNHENTQPTQNTQVNILPQQPAQYPMNTITSDFFSQAIASALASTPAAPSQASNQVTNPLSHQVALQQMRAMGIINDNLSLRALEQTDGDVEAALALIFEGQLE